jgi:LysM repeat protein
MRTYLALALLFLPVAAPAAHAQDVPAEVRPLDEFSPVFLGMYRKLMVIEDDIRRYSAQYGVDFDLARAVCLYESGGNADLTSHAGARGYFQVMRPTFRELRVDTNLEAGVKYLSQLVEEFGREDRAIAAYNGGMGRVGREGGLPLETLQYVIGVGQYRGVLKQYDASLRYHASRLQLVTVGDNDDWASLVRWVGVPEWELRLYNAFLSGRRLRPGDLVAYPQEPRQHLLTRAGDTVEYRTRVGDNYLKLAHTLGLTPDAMRAANSLWHLQSVPAGLTLVLPLSDDRAGLLHAAVGLTPPGGQLLATVTDTPEPQDRVVLVASRPEPAPAPAVAPRPIVHRVERGDTLSNIATRYGTTIGAIQQANDMGRRTTVMLGESLRIPGSGGASDAPRPRTITHRVARGDTLTALAERYNTTVGAIQEANALGRRGTIRIGQRLRIPSGTRVGG